LVNPPRSVGASHVHGITADDVRGAPRFADIAGELGTLLAGCVVLAHNAAFDLSFVRAEFERAGWPMPRVVSVCTLAASHHYLPDVPRRALAACCAEYDIKLDSAHSALAAARATPPLLGSFLDPTVGRRRWTSTCGCRTRPRPWPGRGYR
jgi:DNA polymerase-3 subunit epsilon